MLSITGYGFVHSASAQPQAIHDKVLQKSNVPQKLQNDVKAKETAKATGKAKPAELQKQHKK